MYTFIYEAFFHWEKNLLSVSNNIPQHRFKKFCFKWRKDELSNFYNMKMFSLFFFFFLKSQGYIIRSSRSVMSRITEWDRRQFWNILIAELQARPKELSLEVWVFKSTGKSPSPVEINDVQIPSSLESQTINICFLFDHLQLYFRKLE